LQSKNSSSRKKKGKIGNANFYPTSNIQLPTSKFGAMTRSSFPSSRAFSEAIQTSHPRLRERLAKRSRPLNINFLLSKQIRQKHPIYSQIKHPNFKKNKKLGCLILFTLFYQNIPEFQRQYNIGDKTIPIAIY